MNAGFYTETVIIVTLSVMTIPLTMAMTTNTVQFTIWIYDHRIPILRTKDKRPGHSPDKGADDFQLCSGNHQGLKQWDALIRAYE